MTRDQKLSAWFAGLWLGCCAFVYAVPPASSSFYWQCPIREYLHLDCPGCGMTRALHELLHGHVAAAAALNPLSLVLFPALTILGIVQLYHAMRWGSLLRARLSPNWAYAGLLFLAVFTLVRNQVLMAGAA
jgi:hypothetical protein